MATRCGRCHAPYFAEGSPYFRLPRIGCPACGTVADQVSGEPAKGLTYAEVGSTAAVFATGAGALAVAVAGALQTPLPLLAGPLAFLVYRALLPASRQMITVMPGYLHWREPGTDLARSFAPSSCVTVATTRVRYTSPGPSGLPSMIVVRDWRVYVQVRGWQFFASPLLSQADAAWVEPLIRDLLAQPGPARPPDLELEAGSGRTRIRWGSGASVVSLEVTDEAIVVSSVKSTLRVDADDVKDVLVRDGTLRVKVKSGELRLLQDPWPDRVPIVERAIRDAYHLAPPREAREG